jgi:hypothetical protein
MVHRTYGLAIAWSGFALTWNDYLGTPKVQARPMNSGIQQGNRV